MEKFAEEGNRRVTAVDGRRWQGTARLGGGAVGLAAIGCGVEWKGIRERKRKE